MVNIFKLMGVDQETGVAAVQKLMQTVDDIQKISFILEREFGIVPLSDRDKEEQLDDYARQNFLEPIIIPITEITHAQTYDIYSQLGGKALSGHVKNTDTTNTLLVSWKVRDNFLPAYELEPNEILEFSKDYIKEIKISPESASCEFKALFK